MSPPPSESPLPPVLELRQVEVRALKNTNVTVAREIDWTVAPGDFWVVGAPQHSGKTDFLMTLGGLMAPAAGELIFWANECPFLTKRA
jgi:ABC-type lipoprotein export system ATPase subunit